jgi:hypothetical protein
MRKGKSIYLVPASVALGAERGAVIPRFSQDFPCKRRPEPKHHARNRKVSVKIPLPFPLSLKGKNNSRSLAYGLWYSCYFVHTKGHLDKSLPRNWPRSYGFMFDNFHHFCKIERPRVRGV